jgi:hypothetical protein
VFKRIGLLLVAALMAAMMMVATAAPAFAVTEGPAKPGNKDPQTVKDTGGPDTGLTETYDRKGNTIIYDRDTPGGGGDRQDTTCTKQEYRANGNECPKN